MDNAMEAPDALEVRDLLVGERKSSDVVRETIAHLLRAGMSPAQMLAEIPTLSEAQVRAVIAAVN